MPEPDTRRPLSVVPCGSVIHAQDEIETAAWEAWNAGCWVHMPTGVSAGNAEEHTATTRRMIDEADLVVVCIGENGRLTMATAGEWDYALRQGRPVREYYGSADPDDDQLRLGDLQEMPRAST